MNSSLRLGTLKDILTLHNNPGGHFEMICWGLIAVLAVLHIPFLSKPSEERTLFITLRLYLEYLIPETMMHFLVRRTGRMSTLDYSRTSSRNRQFISCFVI